MQADQDVTVDILIGAELIEDAVSRSSGGAKMNLQKWADGLKSHQKLDEKVRLALDEKLAA